MSHKLRLKPSIILAGRLAAHTQ